MKPQHTKGPWFAEETRVFTTQGAFYIAETQIKGKSFTKRGDEAIANARLIAAAPELLLVLERLVNELQILGTNSMYPLETQKIIADVINKARG